jgi:hypothetical protein
MRVAVGKVRREIDGSLVVVDEAGGADPYRFDV